MSERFEEMKGKETDSYPGIKTRNIPEETKIRMMEFFMKTSVPRIFEEMERKRKEKEKEKDY